MVEGNKNKVKLLICYHKPAYLLKDNVMTPIHVGRANAKVRMGEENPDYQWLVNNMIGDDTGEIYQIRMIITMKCRLYIGHGRTMKSWVIRIILD